MSTDALRLIVCTFDGSSDATEANAAIAKLRERLPDHSPGRVAVVQRDENGAVHFREPGDPREMLSELASTFTGGIAWFIGSFAGMLGPAAAATAENLTEMAVHQLVRDAGFPDDALYAIGHELRTGSSALVALLPLASSTMVIDALEGLGGTLHEHDLPPAVVAKLRAGAPETR